MDNVIVSANIGTGATVATDDIGGVQHQRVKITLGADSVSDGDVSATNPMPTKLNYHHVASGLPQQVEGHDGCLHSMDYLTAIGSGKITGHKAFHSIGYNPDVDNIREDICEWGGTYIPPPAGGIRMVVQSTSAADDGSPQGTGVWTVEINYLDANGAEQTEFVTTNGLTGVQTAASDILRVNYFHTKTADITTTGEGHAAGNITLKNIAGTATYAQISAEGNFSRHGFFTIPAGKKGYLTGAYAGVGGTSAGKFIRMMLRATCDHDGVLTPGIFQFKRMILAMDAGLPMPFSIPIPVPALTDIKFSGVDESNAYVATYVEGWCEDL